MSTRPQTFFDAHATAFDSIYLSQSWLERWFNRAFRQAVYERFNLAIGESGDPAGKTVLDVGCGSGRYMVEYARLGARRVVGVDYSTTMLDLARDLTAAQGVSDRCEFLPGDFLKLSFDHPFDIVLAMGVFDYVAQPRVFLSRMVELARGTVIASFPGRSRLRMRLRRIRYRLRNCPVFFYTEPELHQIVGEAGLSDYRLAFIPHSGTGFILIGQTGQHQAKLAEQG
jgi:SAM-dependent methyltransferase